MNKEILLPADEHYAPAVSLTAGNLNMIYDAGKLRYITAGGKEIVRMIYPALRDSDWATIEPVVSNETIRREDKSFDIRYQAAYKKNEISYQAWFVITGTADGVLEFSMDGEALSNFLKRRVGLCLLQPVATPEDGEPTVTRPDGTTYTGSFPDTVSPNQPLLDIHAMQWSNSVGMQLKIVFEGETFEMEDQRNWSDNSYKIYSTPLALPAPAQLKTGDKLHQTIRITADTSAVKAEAAPDAEPETLTAMPALGYARPTDHELTDEEIEWLQAVPFDHYRVELTMNAQLQPQLAKSISEAARLNTRLELVLIFYSDARPHLETFVAELAKHREMISSILLLSGDDDVAPMKDFEEMYKRIKSVSRQIPVGYGTNGNFAELNRHRPVGSSYDFVSFSLHPQVHQTDSRTIMENLGSHASLMHSVKQFTDGRSVHVSPVLFSDRDTTDDRFGGAFSAWWMLQALRNLRDAASITFFATTGAAGILKNGQPTEIYKVLKELAAFVPRFIVTASEDEVIFENKSGHRLQFRSALPPLNETR